MQNCSLSDSAAASPCRFHRRIGATLSGVFVCAGTLLFLAGPVFAAPWKLATAGLSLEIVPPGSRGDPAFHLERRTADDLPDGRFGPRGRIRFTMGPDNEPPAGLGVDATGRILVVGSTQAAGVLPQPVVLRFLPTGAPDALWGDAGRSQIAPAAWGARALDALPLADGRVLVVGTVEISGDERAALWHLRADGRLDESAGRGTRLALASADASRVVSLTPVSDTEVVLGVRVLTDAGMVLEGHALNPADVNASPKVVSRQPWPPAWSDAPVWLAQGGASRWADPARPKEAVAVAQVGSQADKVAWQPLTRTAPADGPLPTTSVPMAATSAPGQASASGREPGGVAFNPYTTQESQGNGAAAGTAESQPTGSIVLFSLASALAVAGAATYALLRRRKRPTAS